MRKEGIVLTAFVLGALIGYVAAQRRGSSPVTGIISGVLLGPLAVLMCLVSSMADAARRECPECATRAKGEAADDVRSTTFQR